MVRYTGRQKTITGAVNRNQVGLKMSGCPSRVGRSGKNIRFLGRRVNCMYGLCGPTMVNGAPWRTSGRNKPPYCRQRSTSCAQAAGGVGHINSPYTRTRVPAAGQQGCTPRPYSVQCIDNPALISAIAVLTAYATAQDQMLCMIGDHETVHDDLGTTVGDFTKFTDISNLSSQQLEAIAYLNGLRWVGPVTTSSGSAEPQLHVAAMVTSDIRGQLLEANFGQYIDCAATLMAFADTQCTVINMRKLTCPRTKAWWDSTKQQLATMGACDDGNVSPYEVTLKFDGSLKTSVSSGYSAYNIYFRPYKTSDLTVEVNCFWNKYLLSSGSLKSDNRVVYSVNEADFGDIGYECAACLPTVGAGDTQTPTRCLHGYYFCTCGSAHSSDSPCS